MKYRDLKSHKNDLTQGHIVQHLLTNKCKSIRCSRDTKVNGILCYRSTTISIMNGAFPREYEGAGQHNF